MGFRVSWPRILADTPSRSPHAAHTHAIRGLGSLAVEKCGVNNLVCDDVFHPNNRGHLPTGEITLAEALKKHGGDGEGAWITAALSKWHLGYALENGTRQRHLPTERGFDFFHGTQATHCESGGGWPSSCRPPDQGPLPGTPWPITPDRAPPPGRCREPAVAVARRLASIGQSYRTGIRPPCGPGYFCPHIQMEADILPTRSERSLVWF